LEIIDLICKGYSIRAISKTTGHHRDIISNKLEVIALKPDETNKYLQFNLTKTTLEIKRFWEAVKSIKTSFSKEAYGNVTRMIQQFSRMV
jgi:hypothetical protein